MKITGDKSDLSISQAGAGTATRQCEDPTKQLPITQRPGPLENMDGSHNGEPPPPGTEDVPEGFLVIAQNEESSQTVVQTEETEPKPMEIVTQNLEVEKESGSKDLKTTDLSSDDDVKKDSSKKKSKKHKKHKNKKKKKKKKKEKNEKRSKSTSSVEDQENASSELKSAWKPVTSSPKEQDKLNTLSPQIEQNVDALPSLGDQDDNADSVKEHPAKPQLDTDSGFFGPKCPNEMQFSVCSNKPTVCEVEMQEPSKDLDVDCQQNKENVKCTDQNIEKQPKNSGTAEALQNEMSLPQPALVLSEGIGVELGASRLNSEGSKDLLTQSDNMSSSLLQPLSKIINSASLSKSTAKSRSRSNSLAREVRSRSKSLTKVPKKQAYSKSLTRQRSRSSSMVRRQRSRSSSVGQRRRSKSPVRRRRSRSRTSVRYSKSPIRSWWSKSIKNRQRSVSIERRRRSRTRSLAKRRRSRSRSSEKGQHSKTGSSAKRISSRSRSVNRRKSRSPNRKQRLRSSSASKRKSKSAIRTPSKSRSPSRRQKSKSVSPLRRQKSKTSSPVRRRRSRSGAASRRHRSRSGSGSRRRKSRSGSFTRRCRSGSVPRRGRSRSSFASRRRKSRSGSAFRRRRSRSAVASRRQKSRSPSAPRRRRRSRSPSVPRLRRTRSPSISRRRRTRSPSVSRRRRTRSPSVSRRRRTRSPSVSRRRRTRSPSVSRRRRTRSPSVSRRRRTRSPSVSRRRRTRSPSFSRRRRTRSPSFSRRRKTRSPSVSRRRKTRSPSISGRRRSRSPSISRRRMSRSASASRRRRSQSASRRQKSRSGSNARRLRSRSGSGIQRQKSQSYSAINRKSRSTSVARVEQSTLLSSASKVQSEADKLSSSLERRSRSKEKNQSSRSRSGSVISKSISVESEPILQSKSSAEQKMPATVSLDEKRLSISASTVESFDPNLSTVEKHSEDKLPDGSSTSVTEPKSDSYCDNAIDVESSAVLAAPNFLAYSSTTSVLDDHMKSTYSKCPTEQIISSDIPFNENGSTECDMDIDEISSPTQADYIELQAEDLNLVETSKEEYEFKKTNYHAEQHTKVVDIRIDEEPEQKTSGISAENETVCKPFGGSSDFELTEYSKSDFCDEDPTKSSCHNKLNIEDKPELAIKVSDSVFQTSLKTRENSADHIAVSSNVKLSSTDPLPNCIEILGDSEPVKCMKNADRDVPERKNLTRTGSISSAVHDHSSPTTKQGIPVLLAENQMDSLHRSSTIDHVTSEGESHVSPETINKGLDLLNNKQENKTMDSLISKERQTFLVLGSPSRIPPASWKHTEEDVSASMLNDHYSHQRRTPNFKPPTLDEYNLNMNSETKEAVLDTSQPEADLQKMELKHVKYSLTAEQSFPSPPKQSSSHDLCMSNETENRSASSFVAHSYLLDNSTCKELISNDYNFKETGKSEVSQPIEDKTIEVKPMKENKLTFSPSTHINEDLSGTCHNEEYNSLPVSSPSEMTLLKTSPSLEVDELNVHSTLKGDNRESTSVEEKSAYESALQNIPVPPNVDYHEISRSKEPTALDGSNITNLTARASPSKLSSSFKIIDSSLEESPKCTSAISANEMPVLTDLTEDTMELQRPYEALSNSNNKEFDSDCNISKPSLFNNMNDSSAKHEVLYGDAAQLESSNSTPSSDREVMCHSEKSNLREQNPLTVLCSEKQRSSASKTYDGNLDKVHLEIQEKEDSQNIEHVVSNTEIDEEHSRTVSLSKVSELECLNSQKKSIKTWSLGSSASLYKQKVIPKNEERVNLEDEISIQSLTEVNQSELETVEQSVRAEPTFSSLREIKSLEDPKLSPKPFLHETGRLSVPVQFKFSKTFKTLGISQLCSTSEDSSDVESSKANTSSSGVIRNTTASASHTPRSSSKTSPVLTTQQTADVDVDPYKSCSPSQDVSTEPYRSDHQFRQLSERDILHPDNQATDDSQTGSSTKHTFPHISNAVSKLGVKQRQYRSRSVAQDSRTPSVDRGHTSRSRSKSRRRRSHSKSSSRKKRSESTARKKSSHSKSVRRKRSRSRGRKRRSQSKSKGKKKRSTSKLSGKRKRSKSKSSEAIRSSKPLGKHRSSRSTSKTRKYRLQSKSPEKKGRSRSKSETRKNLHSKTASTRKKSLSKSPNWRRKSHSKSLSRSRSRSVSGSWKRFSNSKSSLQRKRSHSSSRSASPRRRSRSRNKRRSFSRSPAARSNSRSRSRWQHSKSRERWRRSRSLSASRHRSRSTSRLSSSLSTKKRKSLSPVRRRRSRSQIKQKDKSPVSKRKSTSPPPPPPPQKKSVQSKPAGFKHSIGLKSLIQKQLSQAKSQGSTGKLFKEQISLPNVTSRTQLSMFSLRSQASVSSLSNIGQIPIPNLAEVPLPSGSQVPMPNVPPADHLSVSSLAAETQLSVPDLTSANQWHVPDMSSGAPWSMPDIAAGTQWSMADIGTGTHWPISELTAGSHWPMHDLTGAQWSMPDLAAGTQWAVPDVASGAQWAVPDLAAGTQWTVPDLTVGSQWAMTNLAGGAQWAVPDLAATAQWTVPDLTAGAQIQRADLVQEAQVPGSDLSLEAQVPGSDLATEAQVPGSDLVAEAQVPGSDMVAEAELPPEHGLHPEEHNMMPDVAAEALVPVASSTLVPDVAAGIPLPDVAAAAAQMPVLDVAATIHMPDVASEAQKQMSNFVAAQVYMSLSPEESVEDSHFEEPIVSSEHQTESDSCDAFVQQSSFEPSVNTLQNLQMEETLSSAQQLPVDFENSQIAELNDKTILLEKPDLQLYQEPATPDLQLYQEPVTDLLSNLPQVEPGMDSECPLSSETCTPSNVPFAASETSDYANIAIAISSPVHSIPVESNPMQEHSLIDNSLQSEPHDGYSNTFVESQSSSTQTGYVEPSDDHDQPLLAVTNSMTENKLQVEPCPNSHHTLMEEASSKWIAPYASPEPNDDQDQPLLAVTNSITDNNLQVEPCPSSDHTLMEEASLKLVAPYASPEPNDDYNQPLLAVTNSVSDNNLQVEPCHSSDHTLMEEPSSKWVALSARLEPSDDHDQPLLAVTNSMTDNNLQVEPCHSSYHTLMEEASSKLVAPYASPESNDDHNQPPLAVINSMTDNLQVEPCPSSDHTLMEEPSSKWVALYASHDNILQNEHPVNSNTTPEIGSQSISDFNEIKACIPDHSQKVDLNPSLDLPQPTESYAGLKQPQLVEPYTSPDHPQLVEPYSSPVLPQLVEPYNSPQRPPLVEHYSSPDHPLLVEPYASPEFPQLVEPYASPDHEQPVEPDTEHAQICQPCMSPVLSKNICSPAEKPEVHSISGHTLSEATICTQMNTDLSCSDGSEIKNNFPTLHENAMTSGVPKNDETIGSVYPPFCRLNDTNVSVQEVPCPSLLKAYSLESNFSPKETTSEECSPTERQSVETCTGAHLEHSTSPAQPLTKYLCSPYPIHEDEAFPITDEKPLNSCSSPDEPKLDSPCLPTNEQLLDEQFVTDEHSQSKELCAMKEVFQPHKDLICSEHVQEKLYDTPVQTLESFPSPPIPHTNEPSLNASHVPLTEYEHLSAEDLMNHPDKNLVIPGIPNTIINLDGGGPPCTIMPLPDIPEQETNTEYSCSEESEAAPGWDFPDRLVVTQVDELLDKPSPSSEPVMLHDSQDKDTCCSSPSKELSDCPNTFLPEQSFNADHSTPSEYSTKIKQCLDQTIKPDANTVFQSELSLDRYVENTLPTENASVPADLQFLNQYKLDCSAPNQATDLSVECLKEKLEDSSECIKTDNHFTTTPPDLLPYDSDQPTDMCSEHSSEPVPFNSQPPPELLPYDSEQPANSFLSTSDYSNEQGSSDFHAPPELLPYDSDQPIVLHSQHTEPGGEELPVYDTTTIHQEPYKALDLPSMDSVESLNIHEIPEKCEPSNETDHTEINFVREVSSDSSIVEFPSTEHTITSETLQEHSVPPTVLDCSQEYPSSPWSSTDKHLPAQKLAEHEQPVVQTVLGSVSPEPLISMCEKQTEETPPLTNLSDHSEVQCSSSYELNTSESEMAIVLPLMQDEILVETAKESSSPKSLTNTECPQSPPTSGKTDPISEWKSSHERSRSSSIDGQKSRSISASRNKRSRSKSVTRAKKSRSKSLVKSKSTKSRSASTESNRRSPVVKKKESTYVAHKRSSRSASVGRRRRSRSSSLSPRKRSPSVDRKCQRRRSHSQSRQRQSRSPSEFRRRSRSPSVTSRRRSSSVARKRRSRSPSVARKRCSPSVTRKKSSPSPATRRRRSPSITRRRRTPSPVVRRRRTPSPSAPRRRRSPSAPRRRRSRSLSAPRRRRSRSLSASRRRRSPSPSAPRRRRSPSPPTTRRRRSPSPSATRRRRSPSPSASRRRRSPSTSEFRRKRSPSLSVSHKRQSHSPSIPRKKRSRSTSVSRRRRSRSASQRKRSRSPSAPRKRRSKSKSPSKSPIGKQSKSDRSRSPSQSKVSRKRKTRSRSSSREKKAVEKRRKRSSSKDSSKDHYSIKQRRKSRTPPRRKKSRSPARRASVCKSPVRRRRSRSPIRRKSFSRSPIRRKRSRSRDKSMDSARSPKRLTDLDKAQLLEIAKANAAAMCAKAGVPLSLSLKPVLTPIASGEEKITNRNYGSSIQELTEKCKQIAQSKEDDVIVNKPHDSDDEEEDRPFYNHPFKVTEHKPISFSLLNPSLKPAPKTQVTLTKEFPVSSGSQHRKKESDKVYGEWVPVDKNTEESKEDVFTNTAPAQPVDITSAMTERAAAQTRLTGNPYDIEALYMLTRSQEQIDAWAKSTSIPGLFTGSTGAQILSAEEISNSGPQAWFKKDQFLKAAPVSGGRGALLMRKMGWKEGEGLGRNNEGNVDPILLDFKADRKGLLADGEKASNKLGLPAMKDLSGKHPISALMELCNKKKWSPPDFDLVDDTGPEHRKRFLFRVTVNGVLCQPSQPSLTKKLAKATAAAAALQALGALPKESMTSTSNFCTASTSTL